MELGMLLFFLCTIREGSYRLPSLIYMFEVLFYCTSVSSLLQSSFAIR